MTLEEYTLAIGKVLVNFHSLEFSLRMFIWNAEQLPGATNSQLAVDKLSVGQEVPVNAYTNYDSLGVLVEKFNALLPAANPEKRLDDSIVQLRDALAHGRVWSQQPSPPLQLVKFARPSGGHVAVTHAETVDQEWLRSNATRVRAEIDKVVAAGSLLQPGKWPAP